MVWHTNLLTDNQNLAAMFEVTAVEMYLLVKTKEGPPKDFPLIDPASHFPQIVTPPCLHYATLQDNYVKYLRNLSLVFISEISNTTLLVFNINIILLY